MIGRAISHYRVLSALGSGGMGVVYLAEDERLGRQVALKFLPQESLKNRQALDRFRVEARAASSLSHPGICAIYDIGEDDGMPFIVMEALRGENLRDRINKGPLKIGELVDIGIQLADALEAAHNQGIIHRDIKPSNIFVGDKNRVKILDFGLAKFVDSSRVGLGSRRQYAPDRRQAAHDAGLCTRHRLVHVARAGTRRRCRYAHRSLLARGGDLRDGDRHAGIRRQHACRRVRRHP
jgi:serine/threonine protein kinase